MNPWKSEEHKKVYKHTENEGGITLSFDSVPKDLLEAIKDFTKWVSEQYDFPIRINVIVTKENKIKLPSGKREYSHFKHYERHSDCEIILPTGRYKKRFTEQDIIGFYIKELTHYMQWINQYDQVEQKAVREAKHYKQSILKLYLEDKKTVLFGSYTHRRWKHTSLERILLTMLGSIAFVFSVAIIVSITSNQTYLAPKLIILGLLSSASVLSADLLTYQVHISYKHMKVSRLIRSDKVILLEDIKREMKLIIKTKNNNVPSYDLEIYTKDKTMIRIKEVDYKLIAYLRSRGYRIPRSEAYLSNK